MLRDALVLLVAAIPALLPAQARIPPQQSTPLMDTVATQAATPTARQALGTFARLVTRANARSLGFNEPADVATATLGVPIQEVMVRLDQLVGYRPQQSPMTLLQSNERLLFPVLINGSTRSSLTLSRQRNGWVVHSFGAPGHSRTLDALRGVLAQREGLPPENYFEVRVPALNVAFLGRIRGGDMFLTPLADDRRFGFERGGTISARLAFGRMVNAARNHNGLPT